MSMSKIILNVTNRDIHWPILVMASCDGDGCLVTSQDDGYKH